MINIMNMQLFQYVGVHSEVLKKMMNQVLHTFYTIAIRNINFTTSQMQHMNILFQ